MITALDQHLRLLARRRGKPLAWLIAPLLLLGSVSGPLVSLAHAEEPAAAARTNFRRGSIQAGLGVGYGLAFRWGSAEDRRSSKELAGVDLVNVIPRLGLGLTDPMGTDAWYRGNIELLFEGALLVNTGPTKGIGGGAGSTLRYNFLRGERFIPFLDANFGVVGLDMDLERQADGFAFNVGFGAGAHWFVAPRTSLSGEFRWQHISNAKTHMPNDGINTALFVVGVTHYFH